MGWTGLLANMVAPLIMVSLGISLDLAALRGSSSVARSGDSAIKLLVAAGARGRHRRHRARHDGLRLLALQAGMPSVMLSLVVGQRFKLDTDFIASAILVTTIGCLVTIPLVQLLVR